VTRIDKRRARRNFERAAGRYDGVAVLQREIADRLLERLDYVRLEPKRILDLGSGTGYAIDLLQRRYRQGRVIAVDFAESMLAQARRRGRWLRRPLCVCADMMRCRSRKEPSTSSSRAPPCNGAMISIIPSANACASCDRGVS
jgi:SAM-dependent methyltransferase